MNFNVVTDEIIKKLKKTINLRKKRRKKEKNSLNSDNFGITCT